MEIHAHNREGKRRRHFKPISEIIRDERGRKIGRIIRRELQHRIEAYGIGAFATERAAIRAVRAEWMARR